MPLKNGVDSFHGLLSEIHATDEELLAFFDAKPSLLAAFMTHPEMITMPYAYSEVAGQNTVSIPADPPLSNPIYLAVVASDLLQYGANLACGTDWIRFAQVREDRTDHDRVLYAEGHALIDMACYIVHLINIYDPNKTLINNLISTNSKIDALGRDDSAAAERAVEKLIKRLLGADSYSYFGIKAQHIVTIAKHEAMQQNQKFCARPGIDFEHECETRLLEHGFDVQTTPAAGDFGADIIATKDGLGYAIQCKDTSKPVGVKAIQEAVAARSHYRVDYAVVCASAGFTDAALELASSNKTILCNADQLAKRLNAV